VHPTHEARPAGCWAPKDAKVALEQTSGRQRLNIHGAIDVETGATRMIEATTVRGSVCATTHVFNASKVHYIPSYWPHLDPIERLWGLMHRHVTHNRCYATYNKFCRKAGGTSSNAAG
jgi:transposase